MTHIKCRYHKWICGCGDWSMDGLKCKDPENGDGCKNFRDQFYDAEKGLYAVTARCIHVWKDTAYGFEDDYKKYDLNDSRLHVGKKLISIDSIDYLEIDGHVYIDETEANHVDSDM